MSSNLKTKPDSLEEIRKKLEEIKEINGPKGLEPTRYGDWEVKGRLSDF